MIARQIPEVHLSQQEFSDAEAGLQQLTKAEYEVLVGLCHSKSVKEIAFARGVSTRTVETQKRSIAGKLGALRSRDLFRLCLALGQHDARTQERTN
jgi:DNA-binding NarL/FixJ family response regulator